MLADLLQKSKEDASFIQLNYYGSDEGFYIGYVVDYFSDFVVIKHYSKYGEDDGLLVLKLVDIKYCETDTPYSKALKLLRENSPSISENIFPYDSKRFGENFLLLFESMIGDRKHLIKIELNDEDVHFGFLEWCDDTYFSIITVDNLGIVSGKAIFKFEDLKLYWINDLDCRRRQILFNANNK